MIVFGLFSVVSFSAFFVAVSPIFSTTFTSRADVKVPTANLILAGVFSVRFLPVTEKTAQPLASVNIALEERSILLTPVQY